MSASVKWSDRVMATLSPMVRLLWSGMAVLTEGVLLATDTAKLSLTLEAPSLAVTSTLAVPPASDLAVRVSTPALLTATVSTLLLSEVAL